MKYLKILLLLLAAFAGSTANAQQKREGYIDSLLNELPRQKEDTNKVNILTALSLTYSSVNPDEGIKSGKLGLALAEQLDWGKGIAAANSILGTNYRSKSEFTEAMECFVIALKIAEASGDKSGVIKYSGDIAMIYTRRSELSKALEYYHKALAMAEELGDKIGIAMVTGNMGIVYKNQGDYPKALEYYFKSLKINEELGRKSGIATNTGNIGVVYVDQSDYTKALEYYFKSLKMYEELGDKIRVASVTSNIGIVYFNQLDYPKALEYLFKSIEMNEELGRKRGVAGAFCNIGMVYQDKRDYTKALYYYQRSLKLVEELGDKYFTAVNMCNIGLAYVAIIEDTALKGGKNAVASGLPENKHGLSISIPVGRTALLAAAIERMERSLTISMEIEALDILQNCYEGLSKAYKLKGDYKKSLEASDNYHAIKDSVYSLENKEEILKMGMKNDYDRQRLTDSLNTLEQQNIASLNLQKQKSYTYIGVAGILLLSGFSFFLFKERGKSEKLLLNILPAAVAKELKANGNAEAKLINEVTVLFTDFKGFTQLSEKLSPKELVGEINLCFSAFDNIMQKYGVEKIKTIGDAYMAAGGLPTPNKTHADDVVKAAIEIQDFMRQHKEEREAAGKLFFEIRIGIHTGPVVAGIVGVKKFAYDIWGDTVNTASRMESSGSVGKVNISQTTYELVKDKFACEYRGEIEVKGKGKMKMYFVG